MNPKLAILAVFAGLVVLMGGCTFIAGWSKYDSEVRLRKFIQAKSNTNEAVFDTMKKIIREKGKIAKVSQQQIEDILKEGVKGRAGGALFKTVQEQYPDPAKLAVMWKDLSATIEAERKGFLTNQKAIQDMVAERESLINGFMSRKLIVLFGGDTTPMKRKGHPEAEDTPDEYQYVFITSTDAEKAARKGLDDKPDTDL